MDIEKLDVLIRLLDGADFGDADDVADELFDWACDEFILRTGEAHPSDPGDEDDQGGSNSAVVFYTGRDGVTTVGPVGRVFPGL